jgi:hypothetical protein
MVEPKPRKVTQSIWSPSNASKDPKGKKGAWYEPYLKADNKMPILIIEDKK